MIAHKFWMVHGLGKGSPTIRHESFASAAAEAKRLAGNNPGDTFVVLEAMSAVAKREFDVIALRERQPDEQPDVHPF